MDVISISLQKDATTEAEAYWLAAFECPDHHNYSALICFKAPANSSFRQLLQQARATLAVEGIKKVRYQLADLWEATPEQVERFWIGQEPDPAYAF